MRYTGSWWITQSTVLLSLNGDQTSLVLDHSYDNQVCYLFILVNRVFFNFFHVNSLLLYISLLLIHVYSISVYISAHVHLLLAFIHIKMLHSSHYHNVNTNHR